MNVLSKSSIICDTFIYEQQVLFFNWLHASLPFFAALAESAKGGLLLAKMMPKYDAPSKTKFGIMMFFLLQNMLQTGGA